MSQDKNRLSNSSYYWLVITSEFLTADSISRCLSLNKQVYIALDTEGLWLTLLKRDCPNLLFNRYKFNRNYYEAYRIIHQLNIRVSLYTLIKDLVPIKEYDSNGEEMTTLVHKSQLDDYYRVKELYSELKNNTTLTSNEREAYQQELKEFRAYDNMNPFVLSILDCWVPWIIFMKNYPLDCSLPPITHTLDNRIPILISHPKYQGFEFYLSFGCPEFDSIEAVESFNPQHFFSESYRSKVRFEDNFYTQFWLFLFCPIFLFEKQQIKFLYIKDLKVFDIQLLCREYNKCKFDEKNIEIYLPNPTLYKKLLYFEDKIIETHFKAYKDKEEQKTNEKIQILMCSNHVRVMTDSDDIYYKVISWTREKILIEHSDNNNNNNNTNADLNVNNNDQPIEIENNKPTKSSITVEEEQNKQKKYRRRKTRKRLWKKHLAREKEMKNRNKNQTDIEDENEGKLQEIISENEENDEEEEKKETEDTTRFQEIVAQQARKNAFITEHYSTEVNKNINNNDVDDIESNDTVPAPVAQLLVRQSSNPGVISAMLQKERERRDAVIALENAEKLARQKDEEESIGLLIIDREELDTGNITRIELRTNGIDMENKILTITTPTIKPNPTFWKWS